MSLITLAIVAFIVVGLIAYLTGIYNGLIQVHSNIEKAWANIDVLLKQRYDEIPKLIEACKSYMKYEQATLDKVIQARAAYLGATTVQEKANAENQLSAGLKSLFAVSENYPDLKANQNFLQLQNRVSALENEIADRREFVNESVNIFNIRIQQIPDVFVANMLGYSKQPLLQVPKEETQDVKIQF